MTTVFERPKRADRCAVRTTAPAAPTASSTAWWPRCIDELGIEGKTIGVAPGRLLGARL